MLHIDGFRFIKINSRLRIEEYILLFYFPKPRSQVLINFKYSRTSMCDHLSQATANPKHQNFPSQSLTVGTCSKRPPPVSDRDNGLGLTVNDFSVVFTSCKRPLGVFSDLYFRCVHCYLECMKNFRDNVELHVRVYYLESRLIWWVHLNPWM